MRIGDRRRVVICAVHPEVDGGRFAAKRVIGDRVTVEADIFSDGFDQLAAALRYRHPRGRWRETTMQLSDNDRWQGWFDVDRLGTYRYTIEAWPDRFGTWSRDLLARARAGQDLSVHMEVGACLVEAAAIRAAPAEARRLHQFAQRLRSGQQPESLLADMRIQRLMRSHCPRDGLVTYDRELELIVERERARHGAWYEFFPRSCVSGAARHCNFDDCVARLDYVARLGFDVVYLPPIHPIGLSHRKGSNNAPECQSGDPGSPWAIGAMEGGHLAVHPQLGTLEDFRRFVDGAADRGLEVAMDIAFQCSPDHPWVTEHPRWFRHRPDGTIQHAENPPKRYQDIYPLDFETEASRALWLELRQILIFWADQGIRIFRVDNPHTKPFRFWQWVIAEIRARFPDVIFLAEAFTRPQLMYQLAKVGFSQSYTYFAWRNTRRELEDYFTGLTKGPLAQFFRPSLWPNTPDILTEFLQTGGQPAFAVRFVLAATLGANYGIYGPAFELCENVATGPGEEEYLNSEKYEIKSWDLSGAGRMIDLISSVNAIRHRYRALQQDAGLRFHDCDNEQVMVFSKPDPTAASLLLVAVNLDCKRAQPCEVTVEHALWSGRKPADRSLTDLLTGDQVELNRGRIRLRLDPERGPAAIFEVAIT